MAEARGSYIGVWLGLASTPMHYQINLLLRGKSALSMIFCAIAEVYCGDELVYSAPDTDKTLTDRMEKEDSFSAVKEVNNDTENVSLHDAEKQINNSAEKESDYSADTVSTSVDEVSAGKYRLKALMNVRVSPSLSSRKIATLPPGMIVSVDKIKNDWLHLTNGSFIFYGNGKYAEKVQ